MTTAVEMALCLQLEADLLRIHIECAELKEYDMSWLPGGKKVTRDGGTGKFASKSPSPSSDVRREKLTGEINAMAENLKLSGDILAAKVKQSIKNPGVAGRVDAAFNKGDIRGLKAADWKSLAEESGKLFKDAFALEYRQRVEPFLRQKGKDSVGAKVEDFLDKSLQRLNVIEKSFTDQLGEAATEAFDFKKVLQNVAAGACITAAIAGVAAIAAPAFAIPLLLSIPEIAVETALIQPFSETAVKGGLRFQGTDNKLVEEVLSFVATASVAGRFKKVEGALAENGRKVERAAEAEARAEAVERAAKKAAEASARNAREEQAWVRRKAAEAAEAEADRAAQAAKNAKADQDHNRRQAQARARAAEQAKDSASAGWREQEYARQASEGATAATEISTRDLLKTLGLNKMPETAAELKKAYWAVAKKAHPDVGGSNEAMTKLTEAYEALKSQTRKS